MNNGSVDDAESLSDLIGMNLSAIHGRAYSYNDIGAGLSSPQLWIRVLLHASIR